MNVSLVFSSLASSTVTGAVDSAPAFLHAVMPRQCTSHCNCQSFAGAVSCTCTCQNGDDSASGVCTDGTSCGCAWSGNEADEIEFTEQCGAGPAPPPPLPSGAIAARSSRKCLDVPGTNTENGQPLWMWECTGSTSQMWAWTAKSELAWDGGSVWSKCLDIPDGDFSDGNVVELWSCNGLPQQQWGYDSDAGTLYLSSSASDASMCLDLQNGGQDDGTPVQIYQCLNNANQQWDLTLQSLDTEMV